MFLWIRLVWAMIIPLTLDLAYRRNFLVFCEIQKIHLIYPFSERIAFSQKCSGFAWRGEL